MLEGFLEETSEDDEGEASDINEASAQHREFWKLRSGNMRVIAVESLNPQLHSPYRCFLLFLEAPLWHLSQRNEEEVHHEDYELELCDENVVELAPALAALCLLELLPLFSLGVEGDYLVDLPDVARVIYLRPVGLAICIVRTRFD